MRSENKLYIRNISTITTAYINILLISFKVYKKEKDLKKGIAFPTCLSVNNCVCHFSPSKNDADYILKEGDVVKMYVRC